MNKSESISELAKALSNFQSKMTAVKKDATNPFYKSKYATLDTIWEAIRKPLSENGLSIAQTMNLIEGKSVLETTLYHTSGEWISGTQLANPVKDDPQSLGSAISYARRYSLSSLLGIVSEEDDDGESAEKREDKPKTEPKADRLATLKSLMKDNDIDVDVMKSYMKTTFSVGSSSKLTGEQIVQFEQDIRAGKVSHLVEEAKKLGAEVVDE